MMGQQQQTVTAARSTLRCVVLALAIVALMVAMAMSSAAPAFAKTASTPRDCQLFVIENNGFSQPDAAKVCHADHL